jgi:hypothetical protein
MSSQESLRLHSSFYERPLESSQESPQEGPSACIYNIKQIARVHAAAAAITPSGASAAAITPITQQQLTQQQLLYPVVHAPVRAPHKGAL